nr:mitochondrial amidoxime-reducing component 1-like [Leptinotarsa decemlineata]XP_023013356.1 mitochondrial amidoxime-reducing component 1-like [Leptinotarsa decemlineata]
MIPYQVVTGTTVLVGVATAVALVYLYQKKKKEIIPWSWEEVGTLKQLYLYPLKSGHRVELIKAECTEFGLKQTEDDEKLLQMRDRGLVVYTEKDKEFRSARTYPKMVLIDVGVHDENHLAVDAATMRTLYVEIPTKNESNEITITLHKGEKLQAIDCGDEAALWFSRYILEKDTGLRLGYHDGSYRRDLTKTHKTLLDFYKNLTNDSTGLYSDLTSTNLINQASVNDLNTKLTNSNVTVNNFRPNFVVDGPSIQPYEEETWQWVKIGDVVLRNVKECTRCIMTTIDPDSGAKNSEREPLETLETYHISNGPFPLPVMGIGLEVRKTGFVSVGDKVLVSK